MSELRICATTADRELLSHRYTPTGQAPDQVELACWAAHMSHAQGHRHSASPRTGKDRTQNPARGYPRTERQGVGPGGWGWA